MPDEKERKIIRLEKQIEAMKMCGNCTNFFIDFYNTCSIKNWIRVKINDYCPDWQLEEKI